LDNDSITNQNNDSFPSLSAVLPVNGNYGSVRLVMQRLTAQTISNQIEMIFIIPEDSLFEPDSLDMNHFHSFQVKAVKFPFSLFRAYAEGIRAAKAPVAVLTQDHAFMDENWAEILIEDHKQDWAVVGPHVCNANPVSMVSWADFYISYGEWASPVETGIKPHLPGHNSSYKVDILRKFDWELENAMEGESFFHRRLHGLGYRLLLDSRICLLHLNYETWRGWLPKRYYQGRQFAAAWSQYWNRKRRFLYIAASPAVPFLRLWRAWRNIRRGKSIKFLLRLTPYLLIGLIAESCGHVLGYCLGRGDCVEKINAFEFDRIRHTGWDKED
jgi:hypothetical protein